jgi:DNA-binding transcriptional MerR regulator
MSKIFLIRTRDEETIYLRPFAARLAGVSEDFLTQCEREGLITCRRMEGGESGLDRNDVRRLSLIRRLHQELDLDLDTIDLVLHLRRQVINLQGEIEAMERKARQKERQLLAELQQIRRSFIPEGQIEEEDQV